MSAWAAGADWETQFKVSRRFATSSSDGGNCFAARTSAKRFRRGSTSSGGLDCMLHHVSFPNESLTRVSFDVWLHVEHWPLWPVEQSQEYVPGVAPLRRGCQGVACISCTKCIVRLSWCIQASTYVVCTLGTKLEEKFKERNPAFRA